MVTLDGDASDEELIKSLCQRALDEHGQLDIFFANAGIVNGQPLHNIDLEDFQQTMKVNVQSCFLACKYGSEAMQNSKKDVPGGSIIMTASVAGMRGA